MTMDRDTFTIPAARRAIRPLIASALLTGLVLRLAFGLGYWVDKPLTHDEREYLLLAQNVASGRGFQYLLPDGSPAPGEHFGRAPLYPLFLAGVMRATGEGLSMQGSAVDAVLTPSPALLWAIRISQAGLSALTIWVIALLAMRSAGPSAATIAAWLAAIYPPLVWTPAYVLSETLYGALALGCAAVIDSAMRRQRPVPAGGPGSAHRFQAAGLLVAGVLAGLAVLTRPVMVLFLGCAAPWLWWKRGLAAAASFLLASALVVAPWTLRNFGEHGRFVLVASEGGITFWTGNHPLAIGEGDLAANLDIKRANVEFRAAHPGLSPEQLEPLYYRDAFAWIASNPGRFALLIARKAFYTVVPIGPSYRSHSALYLWASVVAYLAVLPFGVLGLVRRFAAPQALLLLAASSVLAGLIFFPQERFRIPVIDPALIVCAAGWWARRSALAAFPAAELRT
jgi:4-amino-4-deoxy-L-arabinose transferase-like glycosyltransferase